MFVFVPFLILTFSMPCFADNQSYERRDGFFISFISSIKESYKFLEEEEEKRFLTEWEEEFENDE
jgi:hypothetical protein